MFSSTLKRSVATLGVVAGLLAAAGPASAKTMADDSWEKAARTGIHDDGTLIRADSNEVAVEGLTPIHEPAHGITVLDQDLTTVRASALGSWTTTAR